MPRAHRHPEMPETSWRVYAEAQGRGGRRPMRPAQQGHRVAPGLVHRIMAEQELVAVRTQA